MAKSKRTTRKGKNNKPKSKNMTKNSGKIPMVNIVKKKLPPANPFYNLEDDVTKVVLDVYTRQDFNAGPSGGFPSDKTVAALRSMVFTKGLEYVELSKLQSTPVEALKDKYNEIRICIRQLDEKQRLDPMNKLVKKVEKVELSSENDIDEDLEIVATPFDDDFEIL